MAIALRSRFAHLAHLALVSGAAFASFTAGSSCALDPVHDSSVKAMGDEDPAWPQGPYHRAGQPCLVCHGGQGPSSTTFLLAGTVYYTPGTKDEPGKTVDKAEVRIRDARNPTLYKCVYTNCRGNFFVTKREFPDGVFFPVKVSVSKGAQEKLMTSLIGREGSCAGCHKRPGFFDSPGAVTMFSSEADATGKIEETTCDPQTPLPEGECP